tara:strand:+ start:302 stop:688 length:387 start_codon:yes stop_codon:yes gene_type:complete
MKPDLLNFINENALQIMLDLKGWSYSSNALILNDLAVVKPDFYPDNFILATGRRGYIYALGETRIDYAGRVFLSTDELLVACGKEALNDFHNWQFITEKEWVLSDGNRKFVASFTTLDELPKRTKHRC